MPVNRRDFLLFRPSRSRSVAELDCRRLRMRCLEIEVTGTGAPAGEADGGEPPPVFAGGSVDRLFEELEGEVRRAEVLRVIDESWLDSAELRARVTALVEAFRARGGLVEAG